MADVKTTREQREAAATATDSRGFVGVERWIETGEWDGVTFTQPDTVASLLASNTAAAVAAAVENERRQFVEVLAMMLEAHSDGTLREGVQRVADIIMQRAKPTSDEIADALRTRPAPEEGAKPARVPCDCDGFWQLGEWIHDAHKCPLGETGGRGGGA